MSAASSRRPARRSRATCRCRRGTTSAGAGGGRTRSTRGSGCRWCCRSCSSSSSCCCISRTTPSLEAAHVLLAVPFALTGGVYLLWLLGYNFSVAVWVGFIALFGTAVQTGVVMVIYLEEAVARKTRSDGRRADAERTPRGGHRRRAAPAAAEGDDRLHGRRRPAADHVEHARRRRGDEAARRRRCSAAWCRRSSTCSSSRRSCSTGCRSAVWDCNRNRLTREARPVLTKRRVVAGVGAIALIVDGGRADTDLARAPRRRQPGWRTRPADSRPAI